MNRAGLARRTRRSPMAKDLELKYGCNPNQ